MWSNCWKYSQYQNIYDIVYYDKREEKINYLLSIGINELEIQNLNTETAIGKDCFELSLGFNSNGSKVSLLSEKLTEKSLIPYLNDAAVRYCFESYIQSNDTNNAVSFSKAKNAEQVSTYKFGNCESFSLASSQIDQPPK